MFSVYCEKMNQAGLDPAWIGVIGVAFGALIGFISSYYAQKWQHRNTLEIERKKTRAQLYANFTLRDVFKFIDLEVDYIQQLYYKEMIGEFTDIKNNGSHNNNLVKHRAMVRMFDDPILLQNFERFLNIRTEFYKGAFKDKHGIVVSDPAILLDYAADLAGRIKAAIFDHCSFK
ncbi:hypothetical protein [Enterobacter asburiae]|uniref:hypothetical protein n=1 Tax=Enterobacter asburiae TaxID=61645 RepID=UPI0030185EB3